MAVDSNGNVWASFYDFYGYVRLTVWRHGRMPGHAVGGFTPYNPGEIAFDKNDSLVAVEYLTPAVYTFVCNARRLHCSQTGRFTVKGSPEFGALNAGNTDIQLTDYHTESIDVYGYPSFNYRYSYNQGRNGPIDPTNVTQIGGQPG